jgi:hypothetical protein
MNTETRESIVKVLDAIKNNIDEEIDNITDAYEEAKKKESRCVVSITFELIEYNGCVAAQKIKIKKPVKDNSTSCFEDVVVDGHQICLKKNNQYC